MADALAISSIRERDPELWLRTKLDQPWSSGNLMPAVDGDLLALATPLFDRLEPIIRLRLTMSLVGMVIRRLLDVLDPETKQRLDALLAIAAADKDEWVRAAADLLIAAQAPDLGAAVSNADFKQAVAELEEKSKGLAPPTFLPRDVAYVTLSASEKAAFSSSNDGQADMFDTAARIPGIRASPQLSDNVRRALFEQISQTGQEVLQMSVHSDAKPVLPSRAGRKPTQFLMPGSQLSSHQRANATTWTPAGTRPTPLPSSFPLAPPVVPTAPKDGPKMGIMAADEVMSLMRAREDAQKRKRDDEQSALEEKSRKRREREDKKIAKQKAAIATDSVPKPPAAAATKAAPVTSGAVHRSAAEVDAIMQKLIDESPSLAEAQIDQIHQFLIGNYVGDGQVREVVLQQSSEFDEERQKNATSTLVFEMNHANGQWRKVKRKKYSKAD